MRRFAAVLIVMGLVATPLGADTYLDAPDAPDASDAPDVLDDGDPLLIEWSRLLPPAPGDHEPSAAHDCKQGHVRCVERIIRDMDRRLERHGCDHHAIFSLAYLRTTEEYLRAWHEPAFFDDPAFLNHYDAVFARYYFDAEDRWRTGQRAGIDPAWRIAFSAADAREVSGLGNLLLGMNAHINNDLPFTLAEIGLMSPDGTSRKRDHDQVNVFLNRVTAPLREELAARFDPSVGQTNAPGTFDESASIQLVVAWREAGWRNAERLVNAPSEAHRAAVAQEIRQTAALEAELIRATYAYGPLRDSSERDAYCAQNR